MRSSESKVSTAGYLLSSSGQTLRGLKFIIYLFYLVAVGPKNTKCLELVSGSGFGATCTIFRAGAVPGAPGARRGPQGAENRPKTRGRIYHFIRPKVCPVLARGWHDPGRLYGPTTLALRRLRGALRGHGAEGGGLGERELRPELKYLEQRWLRMHPIHCAFIGWSPDEVVDTSIEGIPKWLLGQVVFWRPGVPRPKNHSFV